MIGWRRNDRLRDRRLLRPLLRGQRLARRAGPLAHLVPELGEVVRGGAAFQPVLQRVRQVVVGGVHVAELRLAERLAVAMRHAMACRTLASAMSCVYDMSVCQPWPASFRPTGFPSLRHVRQDHHFGEVRLVEQVGDVDLQLAEATAEGGEGGDVERLVREAQHAMRAERAQDGAEIAVR